ncbi:hypothetical protein SEVIR_3G042500v4 [Setaria viridis]|uniref:Uncharacterized protein n=2 Tax=Setaria TaxID=4554 RepID=K3ZA48_SETIT|nr:UPF0769 protein C21orf59 homolog [Setaria italica]XP_034588459.1 cilia- and flagella-associated protein 298-like [Setaria viridis]RCV15227.1 hypothetical protein SETIT_3G041500v2 [Setaria italica]RCV15228.1 hypothetical protein SETIT_3G041500v2 [Setaria italica]TKW24281.1 hypothetical protein SEVIR_3G042500v2 [Setaria viridis]
MVLLHVKSAAPAASSSSPDADEGTEFLYECAASAAVADVAVAIGALAGLQTRLLSLCRRLRARCADAGAGATGELERALDEAEAYASKEQVQHNRFLSPRALREHIKNIEKKCASALQEPPEALSLQESSSDNKHERIQLWWAGKELAMDHKLCDYIGVNDKTKIVVKLTQAHDER